jgi:hypothetical protein
MLFTWTPEIIEAGLATLTEQQRAALDCFLSLSKGMTKPGPVRLKKYGFKDLHEYEVNLQSARETAVGHFGGMGIRHFDDLILPEPERSAEGRIQHAMRKVACAAAA